MSSILGVIRLKQLELFALGLVKIYMTLRSRMSLIIGVIRLEQMESYKLEVESSLE